jgi:hypothetical protein
MVEVPEGKILFGDPDIDGRSVLKLHILRT